MMGRVARSLVASMAPRSMIVRGCADAGSPTAITFDDGPHPVHTHRILSFLEAAGARATFFLQGQEAARFPTLVRDIHEAGHQVANHAYWHRSAWRVSSASYVKEVAATQALLCEIVKTDLPLDFRPPYGSVTPGTFLALARSGYRFVFWSKDSRDSFLRQSPELVSHVRGLEVAAGDILLFHEDYPQTVDALPDILHALMCKPLRLGRISELAGAA